MATAKKAKPAKAAAPKKVGRPTIFTQQLGAAICDRIAKGESLRRICEDERMPDVRTVYRWLADEGHEEFRHQYARAREDQADFYAEQIIEIADDGSNDTYTDDKGNVVVDHDVVARSRLRVDARKWYASKLAPKKYGDKTTLAGDPENPLQVTLLEQIAANPKSRLTV